MSGGDHVVSATFKRCRSAIDLTDPVLRKIAREINLAEMLLLQYLAEANRGDGGSEGPGATSDQTTAALNHLSHLVLRELEYLRKVKNSEVVSVSGSFVTFRSDDGDILVTLVPEEELQRTCQPLFVFGNVKPRFAKPVPSREQQATPSESNESVYYDACCDLPDDKLQLPEETPTIGRSIYSLLKYIFAYTIDKLEYGNT